MDVNGTRFHLLLSRPDWADAEPALGAEGAAVVWSAEHGGLGLRPRLYRFPRPDLLLPGDRRGADRDGSGHFYHIDTDERSIMTVSSEGVGARWWPPRPEDVPVCPLPNGFGPAEAAAPDAPRVLRGLAVTTHRYLVVAVPEPAQLLVFDLHAGGAPAVLPWPGPAPFRPFDLAARPDGGLWLLEADPDDGAAPARYWGLDRFFRLERATPGVLPALEPGPFQPEGQQAASCYAAPPVTSADGWALDGRPLAVEALAGRGVLLLQVDATTGATSVVWARDGEVVGTADLRAPLLTLLEDAGGAPPWTGHDIAFVPEAPVRRGQTRGVLYVVGQDGNQAFAFTLEADEDGLRVAPRETFFPLRLFGGRALVADGARVFYDFDDGAVRWLPLVAQPKPRYVAEGEITTGALDGREPGCVWHRLVMDVCFPAGTAIRVESRAADDRARLAAAPWRAEPDPYRRGGGDTRDPSRRGSSPELPYYRAFTPDEQRRAPVGSYELLFQRAEGRYLQLRLTFVGTGRSTPRLFALRLHYPRFSYLREYLPAIYRDDEDSAHFLDRFLANAEGLFTEIEGRIAGAEHLFDERLLDAEYLDWLAGWLGTVLDPAFGEARRRLFLRHAVALYAERGTLPGLVRALRLALDECPSDALFAPGALDCDLGRTTCTEAGFRYGVRVVERFVTRRNAGVFTGGVQTAGPGLVAEGALWEPAQGAARLHSLFRTFVATRYATTAEAEAAWGHPFGAVRFPPLPPVNPDQLADWRAFVAGGLAFTYAEVRAADVALYRDFLERRYRSVGRLNARYGTTHAAFGAVPLPAVFPAAAPALSDWVLFASLVVPLDRNASRFDVLVPIGADTDTVEQQRRVDFVRRLVEREKPAHTEFEVRPFWALFRVGEARLGLDTLLDRGSRFLPLRLPGALGATTVGAAHPWGVADRFVAARDRPGRIL